MTPVKQKKGLMGQAKLRNKAKKNRALSAGGGCFRDKKFCL
jgi:hypothetical protein